MPVHDQFLNGTEPFRPLNCTAVPRVCLEADSNAIVSLYNERLSMKKDKRVVEYMLCRKPDAPFLDKTNPPYGQRTPNCTIWGHSLCDFFWLERGEGSYIFTIWSRSMIRERGEGYIDEDPRKEPPPRKRKPWPLLKLPKRLKAESKRNGFGRIDPGSDYDSDGLECFDVLDDVDSDYEGRAKALSSRDSFKILRTSIASPCLCWFL